MKKVLTLILAFCSMFLISCNKDDLKVFNYCLPSKYKIKNISDFEYRSATRSQLYIQDSDNIYYVPEMAKSMPIDVTNEYVGDEWGIEEGEMGKAWKIELRDDLCWENGDKITAQDFIETVVFTQNCYFDVIKSSWYDRTNINEGIIDINDVGIRAIDNSLILIYDDVYTMEYICKILNESNFTLVHKTIYDECFERDEKGNIILNDYNIPENDYGTSQDKYLSYGPYKLVQLDEEGVRLVRNENWFGYKDLSEEYYQTDEIVVEYLDDYSISYDLLVDGKYDNLRLDFYLDANENNSYCDIDEKYIHNASSNIKGLIMINSDYDVLKKLEEKYNNKYNFTILSIPEFREALVYCLNWSNLKESLQKNWDLKALNPSTYYLHPFYTNCNEVNKYTGEFFHDTEEFQDILDDYYNEILGKVDGIEKANQLFTKAYNIGLEKGYLTEDDIIYIDFLVGYDRFGEADIIIEEWKKAISKTIMADKIEFSNYGYEVPEQSGCTVLWQGSTILENHNIASILKYSEMMHFPNYLNEMLSINFNKIVDVNGNEYNNITLEATINDWIDGFKDLTIETKIVSNGNVDEEITIFYKDNASVTNKIMAECEKFVLSDYCLIPTLDSSRPLILSDNIIFNYDFERHNIKVDFRYITYK